MKRSTAELLLNPVRPETRKELRARWDELPPRLQTANQIYGRHEEGCGATVGLMPRCNFACRGCYLTERANTVPPLAMHDVRKQLRQLREHLGQWGNLQLTDGELTLRPIAELIDMIRTAREYELIPMLMTHGDSFRRQPGLLERLMREGGLDEMSLHIDTTQRGRVGYKRAVRETELNPLRAQFAQIVRNARCETGLPLRVATTITTTADVLDEIPDILAELLQHPDVYRIITFLPIAQIGRTKAGAGGGLSSDQVWERIAGYVGFDSEPHRWHYGHPACNRFLMGMFVERTHKPDYNTYLPFSLASNPEDARFMNPFLDRFSGITFRADRGLQRIARFAGMFLQAPGLLTFGALRYAWHFLDRIDPGHRLRAAFDLLRGRIRLHRLTIGTHHFMSAEELETSEGQDRVKHCIFKVPDGDEMVSMCVFNSQGGRERMYEKLRNSKIQRMEVSIT